MTEQLNNSNTPEKRTDNPRAHFTQPGQGRVMVPFLVHPFFFFFHLKEVKNSAC